MTQTKRKSSPHFHLVVFNLDVRNALIIDVNIAKITNVAHLWWWW